MKNPNRLLFGSKTLMASVLKSTPYGAYWLVMIVFTENCHEFA